MFHYWKNSEKYSQCSVYMSLVGSGKYQWLKLTEVKLPSYANIYYICLNCIRYGNGTLCLNCIDDQNKDEGISMLEDIELLIQEIFELIKCDNCIAYGNGWFCANCINLI